MITEKYIPRTSSEHTQENTHTHKRSRQAKQTHTHKRKRSNSSQVKMPGAKKKKMGGGKPAAARQLSTKDSEDEFQHYGRIVKLWGHGMVSVRYYGAGNERNPEVKMREIRAKVPIRRRQNKLRPELNGLVIVSIRSFGAETTGDVIHTYRESEEATLRRMRELPTELIGDTMGESEGEDDPFTIAFGDEDEFTEEEEEGEN